MSGLMEILELLNSTPKGVELSIVPTVLLPLAFLSTGISVVATFIAGLFGVKLKAEGPKKLLEVLLKPKILISALILNAVIYGGFKGWEYVKNGPVPFVYQNFKNRNPIVNIPADTSDKSLHWKQNIGDSVFTEGVVHDGEIFVGTKQGVMHILDAKTGNHKEKRFFGKFLSPRPIVFKGHLYFGEGLHKSHHMRVYKMDPKTRKILATFKTKGHTEMVAVTTTIEGEDYLFSSAGGDGLYALNPNDMTKRWNYNSGHMDSYPVVYGNYLYIGTGVPTEDIGKKRPYAIKIDIKTGKEVWKKELPLSTWFGPIIADGEVCFPLGELHVKSDVGGIQCFTHSGERARNFFVDLPVTGKHRVHKDTIVFHDFKGTLYSWNYKTGNLNWKIDNASEKYGYGGSRQLEDEKYLFFNRDGNGIVYNIESGEVLKKINFNDKEKTFADPLILENGVLVFGYEGTIKKYKRPL